MHLAFDYDGGLMKNKFLRVLGILVLLVVSCSGPRTFLNENADWTFYKQIGVLPFINLSSDHYAGEKVQSAFITELYLTNRFQVMEPGEFNMQVAQELKASPSQSMQELTAAQIKAIGDKVGVQGIIEGEVREYSMIRVGQADYPMISLTFRMIDVPTGNVVWMTSYTKKGGPNIPIISIGETHTLSELTQKACHDVVTTFVGKAF
jgi:polysaccharide biosynthesis protein PelC